MLNAAPNVGPGIQASAARPLPGPGGVRALPADLRPRIQSRITPAQTLDVPTSFGTVRAYRFGPGDGVPVLLLPGRLSATPMWEANLAGFARHRPVWAVDLLGEPGLSVQTRPLAGADDQAAWLAELLDGLGMDAVHLLGLSIGGWSALNLAARRPGKLASLILLELACTFAPITWKVIGASFGAVLPLPGAVRRRILSWIAGGADASEDDPVAALLSASMRDFTASLPPPAYPTDEQKSQASSGQGRRARPAAAAARRRGAVAHVPSPSTASSPTALMRESLISSPMSTRGVDDGGKESPRVHPRGFQPLVVEQTQGRRVRPSTAEPHIEQATLSPSEVRSVISWQ